MYLNGKAVKMDIPGLLWPGMRAAVGKHRKDGPAPYLCDYPSPNEIKRHVTE